MPEKFFRKADFILLAMLVITGIAVSVILSFGVSAGDSVIIKVDGKIYGTYSLLKDRTIMVRQDDDTYNEIIIEGGKVRVESASCQNQVCVDHSPVSSTGESIVCLPNRMILTIGSDAGKGAEYDTISS